MIRAMLAAYRRTLQKTMAQARSMQQVVDEAGLDWLETPDQAVVWGTALGLQDEIEGVLSRSLEDVKAGGDQRRRRPTSRPGTGRRTGRRSPARAASPAAAAGSSPTRAIPDIGGMMSALGTIGNSPVVVGRAAAAAGSAAARRAAAEAARAAASSRPEHVPAGVQALDRRPAAAAASASPRRSSGTAASRAARPPGRGGPNPFSS